jgi:hypothetical protein
VWTQLEAVISTSPTTTGPESHIKKSELERRESKMVMMKTRNLLTIRGSLFPFGTEEVTIEIFQDGSGMFAWRFTKPGDPGIGAWLEGRQLPQEYARFWTYAGR